MSLAAWRLAILLVILFGSLAALFSRPSIAQDPAYHAFADQRSWAGVPNFQNVASNLPFLLVGGAGLAVARRRRTAGAITSWCVVFAGIALVSAGSSYYHWRPSDATLVWDRLPMTIGFMALFVALLAESVDRRLERWLLLPAIGAGLASVVTWSLTGDLRFYAWVQLVPLLTVPAVLALYRGRYSHRGLLGAALVWYVLAKIAETFDRAVFEMTGQMIGGHASKHLLAAAGCLVLLEMLRRRRAIESVAGGATTLSGAGGAPG